MKAQILKMLRSDEIVSHQAFNAALGISGVSLREHINHLRDLDYQIRSVADGYRLDSSPDILYPWEYPGHAANILYYPEVTSTMDIARDLAKKNCPDLTVVIAGRQTKGRGRLKRRWMSEDGGLYFTMVLRPQIPMQMSFRVNFLASLALAKVIREMLKTDAMVKWPNDILVGGRKVSGMLSELAATAGRISFINIGMGVNVNNDPSGAEPGASSLKKIVSREVSKKDLLAHFLNAFENWMKKVNSTDVVSEWKKYTITLGRHVRIVTRREESEGLAVDVDEYGSLILELANGERKKIAHGDCFLV